MPLRLNTPILPPASEEEARWRLVLLLTLPLVWLSFVLSSVFLRESGQAETSFNQIAFLVMEVGIVLAEAVLLAFRRASHVVAFALINGTGIFLLAKLVFLLFFAPPYVYLYREITEAFFWLPAVYMLAFFMPEWRAIQRICLGYMGLMLGAAALAVPRLFAAEDFTTLGALTQLVLANAVFLSAARATIGLLNARAQAMQKLALTDALTGLHNRRFLHDHLPAALEWVRSENGALALIFLDLDGFKEVNDALGHAAGDALLCQVARRLRAGAGADELVVRVSGDEFVLLAPVTSRGEAQLRAERAWTELAGDGPGGEEDAPFIPGLTLTGLHSPWARVTASVGVSVYPFDARDADALLSHADAAMYRVKNAGKNGVQPFERRGATAGVPGEVSVDAVAVNA